MRFDVSARPAEVYALFNQFIAITGIEPWIRKKEEFEKQLKENSFISGYLDHQFALERALSRARDHKQSTGRMPALNRLETGHLYSFIATTARVFRHLPNVGRKALRDAIVGALKSDIGIAPLAFEMRTAAHFMAMGADVDFHDLCGSGGYDLLVNRGGIEVEVECKSVSVDLGRPIHLRRQYQLGRHLRSDIDAHMKEGTIQIIIVTVPDRLHGQRNFMEAVSEKIRKCLQTQQDIETETPCSVSYHQIGLSGSPFDTQFPGQIKEQQVIDYCAKVSGQNIGHAILMFRPRRYATLIAIRSQQPNQPLKGIYRTLRDASKRQLSRARPGIICVQFRSLTNSELKELESAPSTTGQPTGLQVMTSRFFTNESCQHVHTIAYLAPGDFVQNQWVSHDPYSTDLIRTTDIREDSVSYTFTNRNNPSARDTRYKFF